MRPSEHVRDLKRSIRREHPGYYLGFTTAHDTAASGELIVAVERA